MPWYKLIDYDMDPCDSESYLLLDTTPDCENGPYLYAIFADEIPNDPQRRPDIDGTPGLLYYMVRALKSGIGQPYSIAPPVPLEVRMSDIKVQGKKILEGNAENPEQSKLN